MIIVRRRRRKGTRFGKAAIYGVLSAGKRQFFQYRGEYIDFVEKRNQL